MNNMNQINFTDSASLKFSNLIPEGEIFDACTRFFKSASMLPSNTSLGMRIAFSHDETPFVTVFSDAALAAEDYAWMFKPCADIIFDEEANNPEFSQMVTYLIWNNSTDTKEKSFGTSDLIDELCTLGAVLNILVPSGSDHTYVTLYTAQELPLRVRVMLSSSFRGAEICKAEQKTNENIKGVPCEAVSAIMQGMFSVISSKSIMDEPDEALEIDEEFVIDEEELCDSIDEPSAPIEELDLSVRSYNCLKRAGVHTIAQLRAMSKEELQKVRNLGRKSYEEIISKLENYKPKEEPESAAIEDTRSGREMLDELIGLGEVKAQVKRITALAKMQQNMKEKGLKAEAINLNMAFVGNPGTAKTTVARIMAKILYELGILKKSEVIEVGRADLVGRYEGQTASNVKETFHKAKEGLLFIDEAYSLVENWDNAYGDEAINTIVQEMENNRKDTIVVFAGYPKPMEEFLSRNAGLRSRVPFHVNFVDYSAEEMAQIAALTAEQRGFSIHPQALEKLTAICAEARNDAESGNGRFCRNLVENAVLSYAERVYGDNNELSEKHYVLEADDFCFAPDTIKREKTKRIGFCI